jgi:hypothetical protein
MGRVLPQHSLQGVRKMTKKKLDQDRKPPGLESISELSQKEAIILTTWSQCPRRINKDLHNFYSNGVSGKKPTEMNKC